MEETRSLDGGRRARPGRRAGAVRAWAVLAALALAGTAPLSGQERERECRCVDRNGEEIEDCVCIRSRGFETPLRFGLLAPPRARLGVSVSTDQGSDRDARGVRIEDVLQDGPADEAGLREGDVVVRVDGRSVFDPLEDAEAEALLDLDRSVPVQRFLALMREIEPGETVELEYLRGGETRTAVVETEESRVRAWSGPAGDLGVLRFTPEGRSWEDLRGRLDELRDREGALDLRLRGESGAWTMVVPDTEERGIVRLRSWAGDPCFTGSRDRAVLFGDGCVDGLELREMEGDLGEYFSTDRGVLVIGVREGATLGLRAGDVILAVGGREVDAPSDVSRILRSYDTDEDVVLRIVRRGETMEVTGRRR